MKSKLTILALILSLNLGCNFDPENTAPFFEQAGQSVIDTVDSVDETLDKSPIINAAVGDEVKTATLPLRLIGEALLLFGVLFQSKRVSNRNKLIKEVDDFANTPSVDNQVTSKESKKLARKLT